MKHKQLFIICILFFLFLSILNVNATSEETSSISRIVGESASELLIQMQNSNIQLDGSTYFGFVHDSDFETKSNILNQQFTSNSIDGA
ncbi:MAG: hypothetical protein ABIJ08_05070, partial [Nanoarchaeota archaeon]